MNFRAVILVVLGTANLAVASPAVAGVADQSNQAPTSFGHGIDSTTPNFQVFTPGVSGELDQAEVLIDQLDGCSEPALELQVRTAKSGLPTDKVLATDPELARVGDDLRARFSRPATVSAGRSYALVAVADACDYSWAMVAGDPYLGGDGGASEDSGATWFVFNDSPRSDFRFTTYMVKARCSGSDASTIGSHGGERLTGTSERDVVLAYRGKDTVRGLGRGDLICGAEDSDTLKGGPGRDVLIGGPGRDVCVGGPGKDVARGCEVRRSI